MDAGITEGELIRAVDKAALSREIAAFAWIARLADDEITARDYAATMGITPEASRVQLERAVRAGTLTKRQVWDERIHRHAAGYRKAEQGR